MSATTGAETLAPVADADALVVVPAISPVRAAPTSSARIVRDSLDFTDMDFS